MVFAPVLGKMAARCLVLQSEEGGLSWQGCIISLEISVDAMSQNQRHSPGTIPALKGSLHLPFYKKTTEQNNLFSIFHRSNQKKAGSFQLQVISSNINKVFAQYPGFFTEKFP